ncbi:hypothetical protein FB446DRAFT_41329 [Lentinula raphanica]|nr:hypothetical protein FB446DRAFT_41329 [Lentinula raphanica]
MGIIADVVSRNECSREGRVATILSTTQERNLDGDMTIIARMNQRRRAFPLRGYIRGDRVDEVSSSYTSQAGPIRVPPQVLQASQSSKNLTNSVSSSFPSGRRPCLTVITHSIPQAKRKTMSLSLGLNTVPFPSEVISPLVMRPSPLHRRRGVDLGMPLQMPTPTQFGYGYAVGNAEAATAAAAVFPVDTNSKPSSAVNNPRTGRVGYSSGLFGSANTSTFWSPASAVVGTKGPLQPHISNLPRRKPTTRRRE